jgi:hypothetical protein
VIVAGKQPALDYLAMEEAIAHCPRGLGIWEWASSGDGEPDVVLACAGDIPTLETVAAAAILRRELRDLRVRVVNVVDLMRLEPPSEHPHGMSDCSNERRYPRPRWRQRSSADARLGLDVHLHRLRGGVAAMAAALGGLDALLFTGGVGENSPLIRARTVDGLGFLGLAVDAERNEAAGSDVDVAADRSPSAVLVIDAREDIEIARQVRELLRAGAA